MQEQSLETNGLSFNVFSYYPTYDLLNSLNIQKGATVDIFVDLRNGLRGSFYEDYVRTVVTHFSKTRVIDYNILLSLLEFIRFHKVYAQRKGINFNFHFFCLVFKIFYYRFNFHPWSIGSISFFLLDLSSDRYN